MKMEIETKPTTEAERPNEKIIQLLPSPKKYYAAFNENGVATAYPVILLGLGDRGTIMGVIGYSSDAEFLRPASEDEDFIGYRDLDDYKDIAALKRSVQEEIDKNMSSCGDVLVGQVNTSAEPSDAQAEQSELGVGFVYFVRQGPSVKIGFTNNIQTRLKALQTGCPEKLELLAQMPGTMSTEKALHQKFASYRQSGEWFHYDGHLETFIEILRINNP